MKKIEMREIWKDMLCLLPVYGEDGTNGTKVILENQNPVFSPCRAKTLVRRLGRLFTCDLKEAVKVYSQVSGRTYAVPLPLRPGLVLIPVRCRRARIKDDGTLAYIVKDKITATEDIKKGTRITFTDETHLDLPQRWATLKVILAQAELIERKAAELFGYEKLYKMENISQLTAESSKIHEYSKKQPF